jgi:double-stranded uracil-DNA glycosylase
MSLEHIFDPVYNQDSKVLILGTFPSVKSRENNFYYAHPQNRFWKVIAQIVNSKKVPDTVEDKRNMLLENGIAIWDVIKSCEIQGSSDSSIKNVVPANLSRVLHEADIRKIYANGGKAYELFMKYSIQEVGREIIKLPSTSPANARFSLEKLIEQWSVVQYEI